MPLVVWGGWPEDFKRRVPRLRPKIWSVALDENFSVARLEYVSYRVGDDVFWLSFGSVLPLYSLLIFHPAFLNNVKLNYKMRWGSYMKGVTWYSVRNIYLQNMWTNEINGLGMWFNPPASENIGIASGVNQPYFEYMILFKFLPTFLL